MTPTQRKAIEGILAYFNSGNALPVEKATIRGDSSEVQALRAALEQPAAEPVAYGRWHEDGYIDMVFLDRDECKQYLEYEEEPVCLFTTPPPPADVPLLTPSEVAVRLTLTNKTLAINLPCAVQSSVLLPKLEITLNDNSHTEWT